MTLSLTTTAVVTKHGSSLQVEPVRIQVLAFGDEHGIGKLSAKTAMNAGE